MKVEILYIGKPRDARANAIAAEYLKRAGRFKPCSMREVDPRRWSPAAQPGALIAALDPAGDQMTSAEFAALLSRAENAARDLLFLIGGHEGLPPAWRDSASLLLSLSRMTWPHELARAMLAEQIYRGFAALRGHPYPR